MEEKDKDLLLRDLCARLPYGVQIQKIEITGNAFRTDLNLYQLAAFNDGEIFKPYLRPISSLTQEERDKFCDIGGVISHRPSDGKLYLVAYLPEALDYLNSIHADYRGLIEKSLAIKVTEENNPYK